MWVFELVSRRTACRIYRQSPRGNGTLGTPEQMVLVFYGILAWAMEYLSGASQSLLADWEEGLGQKISIGAMECHNCHRT